MQPKAAVINDFTSFGRCSLAVSIPILSAMRVQCCSVPTAIFTNHTGFPCYSWTDYTSHMDDYIRDWKRTGLSFAAVQSGFLGSSAQIDYVLRFVEAFKDAKTIVAIDPVMGDYGRLYATYNEDLAHGMRRLLEVADILTPNLTEASVLAAREYDPQISDEALNTLARELAEPHNAKVVITGVQRGDKMINYIYERGRLPIIHHEKKIGEDRSGTGDVFSSIILGDAIYSRDFAQSVAKASAFVAHAVKRSAELGIPHHHGLAIEEVLGDLIDDCPL